MPKLLAIDYGAKRIGLAITDQKQNMIFPYLTLANDQFVLDKLSKICQKENVAKIIVGMPIGLNSQRTGQTKETENFIELLKKEIKLEIIEEDERLTSKMADKLSAKNRDETAAMIVLQTYLERN